MSTVCVGVVFRSKYVQFPIICSLEYSININTVEVDPHSDLLHICIVKPKNNETITVFGYRMIFKVQLSPNMMFGICDIWVILRRNIMNLFIM